MRHKHDQLKLDVLTNERCDMMITTYISAVVRMTSFKKYERGYRRKAKDKAFILLAKHLWIKEKENKNDSQL